MPIDVVDLLITIAIIKISFICLFNTHLLVIYSVQGNAFVGITGK